MALNSSHFARIQVSTVACADPIGTFVRSVFVKVGDGHAFNQAFPISRYTALYPGVQIKLEDLAGINFVESAFDFNELANALERVILSIVNGDIAGIICTRAEFEALQEFLQDFSREYIDVSPLSDFLITERMAQRLYNFK
jgi:hypothetical protein